MVYVTKPPAIEEVAKKRRSFIYYSLYRLSYTLYCRRQYTTLMREKEII